MSMDRRKFLAVAGTCLGSNLLGGCGGEVASAIELNQIDYDVIVLGGGAAGLTAAWHLNDRFSVKVFEKNSRVGGKAITGSRNGFSYAKGTEYLGEAQGTLKTMIDKLKLQPREIPAPSDIHYHKGQFYYGDDGIALQMIQESSLAEYNRFVKTIKDTFSLYKDIPDLDLKSDIAKLDDLTVRQWFDRNKFPEIFYHIYNVSSKGLFGANIDEISALSFISELYFDYENDSPIASVDELENSDLQGQGRTYTYTFEHGIAEVTDALANALGSKVQLNSTVTSVVKGKNGFQVNYLDGSGLSRTSTSRLVILATPAPIALQVASAVLNDEQKSIMEQVRYSPYITIALFSNEPIFNKGFDLAVPEGYFFTDIYDSTWVQRYDDASLRDRKDSIMSIYIAPQNSQDTALLNLSDEELLARVYKDLEQIYPGAAKKVVGVDIQRFKYAYPVMTKGAYRRLTRLHAISTSGLLLAGDYMIYPTFEAAVESGFLAYELAAEELKKA